MINCLLDLQEFTSKSRKRLFLLAVLTFIWSLNISPNLSKEIQAQTNTPTWQAAGWGGGGNATAVVVDPTDPNTVWAGADIGGPFKSTDKGESWALATNGYEDDNVVSIAVDPTDGNRVYALGWSGLYQSTNGKSAPNDVKWTKISPPGLHYGMARPPGWYWNRLIAINPNNNKEVFVGSAVQYSTGNGGGVWKGVDNGGGNFTWSILNFSGMNIATVVLDPQNPNNIFAGIRGAEMKISRDGGINWVGTGKWDISSIVISPQNSPYVYASDPLGRVYKSTDGGNSWVDKFCPQTNAILDAISKNIASGIYITSSLAIDNNNPNNLYLGMQSWWPPAIIFKTTNGGDSWTDLSSNNVDPGINPYTNAKSTNAIEMVAVDPTNFNIVYATEFSGMIKSIDGGANWRDATKGLQISGAQQIALDPVNKSKIYVSGGDGVLMISGDYGVSWQSGEWADGLFAGGAAIASANTSPNSTIYFSNDKDGANAGGGHTLIRRNQNFGDKNSWQAMSQTGLPTIVFDPNSYPSTGGVYRIVPHPTDPNTVYVSINGPGIYKTTSALSSNTTWQNVTGFPARVLTISASNSNILYGGAEPIVVASFDGGATWPMISFVDSNGNPSSPEIGIVFDIKIDPTDPYTIYISTINHVIKAHVNSQAKATWSYFFDTTNNPGCFGTSSPGAPGIYNAAGVDFNSKNGDIYVAVNAGRGHIGKGVCVSSDKGVSWRPLNYGLGGKWMYFVKYDSNQDTLFAGTQTGLFKLALSGTVPSNQPPVALAQANLTSGKAPLTVSFSSSSSYDPDGNITSYSWNFGDGTTSSQPNPSHAYQSAGSYTATLTATDDKGAIGTTSLTIKVSTAADINRDGLVDKGDVQIVLDNWGTNKPDPDLNQDQKVNGIDFSKLVKDWTGSSVISQSFKGEYFSNQNLLGTPTLVRNDADINFDWGQGSPNPLVPTDGFSVRWTKNQAFDAGNYTFSTITDDGVRLYVDNTLVIDHWVNQSSTTYTANINLTAGNHLITMEYYDWLVNAVARLNWVKN